MSAVTGDSIGLFGQAIIQIGAGGSAGFVEVCIMHPMDLVKTRMQLQVKSSVKNSMYYTGVLDCMKKMYTHEGLSSFWKGIVPPIIAETPKRAVKFFTFEQYKKYFLWGASAPTPLTFALAGFCAGVTEAILVNPFEVVKVQLQSNRQRLKNTPSTFSPNKDPWVEFFSKVGLGFVAGTTASCLNIPFDVAKSRIQGPQSDIKYKGTLRTMKIIYQREGFLALYKGLLPKVLRLGPGGAIMLVVYDYMHAFLSFHMIN
uniref:Mitochondrial 2-oxodicarboxylate carrier n=1 Tax=Fopius arisanus TaxID=64838 RepID=A0A0C9RIV6_9HYME